MCPHLQCGKHVTSQTYQAHQVDSSWWRRLRFRRQRGRCHQTCSLSPPCRSHHGWKAWPASYGDPGYLQNRSSRLLWKRESNWEWIKEYLEGTCVQICKITVTSYRGFIERIKHFQCMQSWSQTLCTCPIGFIISISVCLLVLCRYGTFPTVIPPQVPSKWCRQFLCLISYWCLCAHQYVAMVHSVSFQAPPPRSTSASPGVCGTFWMSGWGCESCQRSPS